MTAAQAAAHLARAYGLDPEQARRVIAIARQHGMKAEPVRGGYAEVRYEHGAGYSIIPHVTQQKKEQETKS